MKKIVAILMFCQLTYINAQNRNTIRHRVEIYKKPELEVFNDFYRAPWKDINAKLVEKQRDFDSTMEYLDNIITILGLDKFQIANGEIDQERQKYFFNAIFNNRDIIRNYLSETGDTDTAKTLIRKLQNEVQEELINGNMGKRQKHWQYVKDVISHNNELMNKWRQIYSECGGDSICTMEYFKL